METEARWSDQIPEKDGSKLSVFEVAISPDGSRLVAGVGDRVLFYRTSDGNLLNSLKAHKDLVYSVSYSGDGSRFSSGGADNIVVIWENTAKGLFKYSHMAPIQKVCWNPTQLILASCSEVDFGFWMPDQKQVTKEKVPARIVSAAWSNDGTVIAIGLLNGMVTIRNLKAEEVLKIEKRMPVWCLAFIPEQQGPTKSNQGGTPGNFPTNSSGPDYADNLIVGCWDKTYTLYRLTGKSALSLTERKLAYYPLSLRSVTNHQSKTNYVVISGSNKQVQILSREGTKLADVSKMTDSWVWTADANAEEELLAYGTNHGLIEFAKMKFDAVHSLYNDRYAYRENLTEVIVHHLGTDKKVRIKCKDMIHNLSLFRNKLAVQLLDRICVYESNADDAADIHFRLKGQKILLASASFNLESKSVTNLMVVTSGHVFSSLDCFLELYSQTGLRQRLWKMDAPILCIKVDGGMDGKEGILVGLANGSVQKFFVGEPFSMEVATRKTGVKSALVNIYRTLVATVDINNVLVVSELSTHETVFTMEGVIAACFNSEVEDLLCVTDVNNAISVIAGLSSIDNGTMTRGRKAIPEVQEQHIFGEVVGFHGQKIYSTTRGVLSSIDVPQGGNILKALENGDYQTAYKIACLGATEADWRLLAMRALRANQLQVARNSFARLKDTRYLSLIENIERSSTPLVETSSAPVAAASNTASNDVIVPGTRLSRNRGSDNASNNAATTAKIIPKKAIVSTLEPKWLAEIMAYEGHYNEAAKTYARAGMIDESVKMFILLRKWEDAKVFARSAGNVDIAELTAQQAKWLQEIKDWKGASDLFLTMNQYYQAARIIGENEGKGWENALIEVVRSCPADDKETLIFAADKLSSMEDISLAKEAFTKAGDFSRIMGLYVQRQMWVEAAKLADEYQGKFDMSVFASYAEWLVVQDRYEEAMDAFKKCGRMDLSRRVLTELTLNAVSEHRFKDAGYYYWMLAKELDAEMSEKNQQSVDKEMLISECEHKADLYYAYSVIYTFVMDPFTTYQPEMLFQVARFIINSLGIADTIPQGISKTFTLYTLAKQAMQLGAFKLARNAYDRLSRLKIPERKMEEVELDMLLVQAKPVRDDPDHLPVCYRCGSVNPLLNPFTNRFAKGDVCTNCGHPFVRSFINFDILPLVEFVPEPSISDDEAIEMIRQPPSRTQLFRTDRFESKSAGGANILSLGGGDDNDQSMLGENEANDLFTNCMNVTLDRQKTSYIPVQVDSNALLAMKRSEVFVCKPSSKNKRATFYKNMLPDIAVAISQPCHRFFHLEDFEFAYLSEKQCPYSRLKSIGEYGSI